MHQDDEKIDLTFGIWDANFFRFIPELPERSVGGNG
jgi:hypothetical protein